MISFCHSLSGLSYLSVACASLFVFCSSDSEVLQERVASLVHSNALCSPSLHDIN